MLIAEEDLSAYAEFMLNFVRCADIYQTMLIFIRYLHDCSDEAKLITFDRLSSTMLTWSDQTI